MDFPSMPYTFTMNTNPLQCAHGTECLNLNRIQDDFIKTLQVENLDRFTMYIKWPLVQRGSIELFMCILVSSPLDNVLYKYRNRNTDCITKTRANISTKLSTANIYADSSMCAIATNIENFNRFKGFTLQYYQIKMPAYVVDTFDNEFFFVKKNEIKCGLEKNQCLLKKSSK